MTCLVCLIDAISCSFVSPSLKISQPWSAVICCLVSNLPTPRFQGIQLVPALLSASASGSTVGCAHVATSKLDGQVLARESYEALCFHQHINNKGIMSQPHRHHHMPSPSVTSSSSLLKCMQSPMPSILQEGRRNRNGSSFSIAESQSRDNHHQHHLHHHKQHHLLAAAQASNSLQHYRRMHQQHHQQHFQHDHHHDTHRRCQRHDHHQHRAQTSTFSK